MDLLKTKIYLDKLNREFARLSKDPDTILRIDTDIMASYVRELYDAVLSNNAVATAPPIPTPPPVATTRRPAAPRPSQMDAPAPIPAIPPPPVVPVPEPVVRETPAPAARPPVVVEEKPAPAAPSEPEVMNTKSPGSGYTPEAEILFEEKQAKELSERLSELPIADLKKAIALNDRLLLTRELFSGDGQAFESAINALNNFTQFADAKTYLLDHCVIRYGWLDKKRVDIAKNFIKLVRRRYK